MDACTRNTSLDFDSDHADLEVEDVIRNLAPSRELQVLGRMRAEGIQTAADLAALDKEDLHALGLSMVERARVLRWSRGSLQVTPSSPAAFARKRSKSSLSDDAGPIHARPFVRLSSCHEDDVPEDQVEQEKRLDRIEQQPDFWCKLVASAAPLSVQLQDGSVRENVLEVLFDLTSEHVKEVYEGIDKDRDGRIHVQELGEGLSQCGIKGLEGNALIEIWEQMTKDRPLRLPEFESILSRLKLAQLLGRRAVAKGPAVKRMTVLDYDAATPHVLPRTVDVTDAVVTQFFFGHREAVVPGRLPKVRWAHMTGFDSIVLLALTVKYSLHPLGVEDAIHQRSTGINCFEGNYVLTLNQLCLAGVGSEHVSEGFSKSGAASDTVASLASAGPVRVRGRHVTAFLAGPPLLDTIITLTQTDRDFEREWPGGVCSNGLVGAMESDRWVEQLRTRLGGQFSRLRRRRADFLMYSLIDLSIDELIRVTRAYTARLSFLEEEARSFARVTSEELHHEVHLSRRRLTMIGQRTKSLYRMLRRIADDRDLSGRLEEYLQDVMDHIDEVQDDIAQLLDQCSAIQRARESAMEKQEELRRQRYEERDRQRQRQQERQAEEMNKMLFVLTVATALFAPAQFLAGVYGMNFQDASQKPTIPELLWPHGYVIFWLVVIFWLLASGTCTLYLWRRKSREVVECDAYVQMISPPPHARH